MVFGLIAATLVALLLWAGLTRSSLAVETLLQVIGYSSGFALAWLVVRLLGRGWQAAVVLLLIFFASFVALFNLPFEWRFDKTGGISNGPDGNYVETPLSEVLGGIPAGVFYGSILLILFTRLNTDRRMRQSPGDQRGTRIAILVVVGAALLLTAAAFANALLKGT